MCGVCGIFDASGREVDQDGLGLMTRALAHRGPDDQGLACLGPVGLGHRRLAVIDLSPAGHQPMSNHGQTVWVVYNGEIYNYRQLREQLEARGHHFRSQSDTEVLIHGYQEWGASCWERLDGIFAFGLYDQPQRSLYLVRDHLGIKPLFYRQAGPALLFASEPLALLGPGWPAPAVEPADLDVYFTFNYLPAPRAGIKGVQQLPAGSCLKVSAAGQELSTYWRPCYQEPEPWGSGLAERLGGLIQDSVHSQLVSDVPVGLFLSGGLDSYAVALGAFGAGQKLQSFTLGFAEPRFDESPAAADYLAHLGGQGENVPFRWDTQELVQVLGAMGELLADASCFPVYQLCRAARQKVTVILSGDGGDELWAGYDTYKAGQITPLIRALPAFLRRGLLRAARLLPSDDRRYGWRMVLERLVAAAEEGPGRDHASFRRIMSQEVKSRLYDPGLWQEVRRHDAVGEYAGLLGEVPAGRSYLTARQHADLHFHLPSILAKVDRMSMAHGLEVRVPLLSRALVEFSLSLPDRAKRHLGKGKRVLRQAIEPRAPREALHRPKAGFLPPVDRWFREPGPMGEVFGDYLQTARARVDGLNWAEVDRFWGEHRRGEVEGGFVLLGILQFINWSLQCRRTSAI
jgi:asparagine synthase (glutamine-hydrolysing)